METILRPRPALVWLIALAVVVLGLCLLGAVQGLRGDELAPAAGVGVVAVSAVMFAAVVWALWRLPRMTYTVSDHDVAVTLAGRDRARLRFADLTEVRPFRSGSRYGRGWDHALLLTGTGPDGRVARLRLGGNLVPSLRPVLEALQPVVDARPELLPQGREPFDDLLLEAP